MIHRIVNNDRCNRLVGHRQDSKSNARVCGTTLIIYAVCIIVAIQHNYVAWRLMGFLQRRTLSSYDTAVTSTTSDYKSTSASSLYKLASDARLSTSTTESRAYPRWGNTIEEEQELGIDIVPVLDFILNSSVATYISQQSKSSLKDIRYLPTSDHKDDVGYWLPETLYVLDHNGLSSSFRHRLCNAYGKGTIKDKVVPTERIIMSAIEYLKSDTKTTCKNWPTLCKTIIGNIKDPNWTALSGIPFLIYFGDYTGCNYHNFRKNLSIPLFSAAAQVECNHAFPFVTHELLEMIKEQQSDWDTFFYISKKAYPWESKKPQVLWRGALTGRYVNETYKNKRWNLIRKIHSVKHKFLELGHREETFLFDAGAVRFPIRPESKHWQNDIDKELGGLLKRIDPMEDYQTYRAILDIDGHSWSSRFNLLLCYNSVIIKVEPTWVDYLQYSPRNPNSPASHIQPWQHYIPVKADLSDLFEIAAFVNDPTNDEILHGIIQNANDWCRNSLVKHSIERDILNILERYVQLLDIGDPKWREKEWRYAKETILDTNSTLKMKVLTMEEDIYFGLDDVLAYKKAYGVPVAT